MTHKANLNILSLLGLRIDAIERNALHEFILKAVREKKGSIIFYLNLHGVCITLRDPSFARMVNQGNLVLADGDGVRFGLWMMGQWIPKKIPLTRWIWDLVALCENEHLRIFLLGGWLQIAEKAAEKLKRRFKGLEIAGIHHGYFDKSGSENDRVVAQINQTKPDILFVCFGMPLQEKWIMENKDKIQAPILIAGGGVLDYISGRLGKAPDWMIGAHLEWLFRIYEEPGRLFFRYATEIPFFFFHIVRRKIVILMTKGSQKESNHGF